MKLYCAKYIRVCKEINMRFMPQEAQVSGWLSFLCDPFPLFLLFDDWRDSVKESTLSCYSWETQWLLMGVGCLCLSHSVIIGNVYCLQPFVLWICFNFVILNKTNTALFCFDKVLFSSLIWVYVQAAISEKFIFVLLLIIDFIFN